MQVDPAWLAGFKVQMKVVPWLFQDGQGDPRESRFLRGARWNPKKATRSTLVNFPLLSFGKRGDKGGVEALSLSGSALQSAIWTGNPAASRGWAWGSGALQVVDV